MIQRWTWPWVPSDLHPNSSNEILPIFALAKANPTRTLAFRLAISEMVGGRPSWQTIEKAPSLTLSLRIVTIDNPTCPARQHEVNDIKDYRFSGRTVSTAMNAGNLLTSGRTAA
jgi:hypothetical protein